MSPGPLILLYHRVTQLPLDPQQWSVTPQHFAEHLEILKSKAKPIPLVQLMAEKESGQWPLSAVVVTFDDGYADNLREAKPLLQKHGIPATVYVTSGLVGKSEEFYWDDLERVLLSPGTLPESLRLIVDGRENTWALRNATHYSAAEAAHHRRWNILEQAPTTRHTVYRSLCELLRLMTHEQRQDVLSQLRSWAGVPEKARTTHESLLPEGLRRLTAGNLIEIGAHTVTHPLLSSRPIEDQQWEIRQSKMDLEEILGQPVQSFSYPYGTADAYDQQTVQAVRDAGFTSACGSVEGAVRRETDPYQLPRHIVRDWDGEEFSRKLHEWFING